MYSSPSSIFQTVITMKSPVSSFNIENDSLKMSKNDTYLKGFVFQFTAESPP